MSISLFAALPLSRSAKAAAGRVVDSAASDAANSAAASGLVAKPLVQLMRKHAKMEGSGAVKPPSKQLQKAIRLVEQNVS